MNWRRLVIVIPVLSLFVAIAAPDASFAANSSVNASPHNLSVGGGLGKHGLAFDEVRVCVFCHTPHNAQPATSVSAPLWNRALVPDAQQYSMYDSDRFSQNVGPVPSRPSGASRVCLGCHDGSIALNLYGGKVISAGSGLSAPTLMPSDSNPANNSNLTTNLSTSHPISFPYTADLAARAQLVLPVALPPVIKLDKDGNLQCTACHNPHNNEFGKFLVMDNNQDGSPLCSGCHIPTGWDSTSPHYAGNGCMNCHAVHNSPVAEYLLTAPVGQVCFNGIGCHDGNSPPAHAGAGQPEPPSRMASLAGRLLALIGSDSVLAHRPLRGGGPSSDMKSLFRRQIYRHPVGSAFGSRNWGGRSRTGAAALPQPGQVECVDCHSSHSAGGRTALANGLKRSLRGVSGVSQNTLGPVIAGAEYEICYKCHAGGRASYFVGINKPNRVMAEPDQMKRFSPANPSFHPVAGNRRTAGTSLFPQYRASMVRIDCSDCHGSNESKKAGGIGPNGPHASRYEHILVARYNMPLKGTAGRSQQCSSYRADYALCFICHMDDFVMVNGTAFVAGNVNEHARHVVDRCIPCFACHDPHGVPAQNGATVMSNAHLINFDKGYAASLSLPFPGYTTGAPGSGSCTVACHAAGTHSYPVDTAKAAGKR
jgi:predicted CXXCH cytochrome family protein